MKEFTEISMLAEVLIAWKKAEKFCATITLSDEENIYEVKFG